ncbi:hypothetical protein [Bacillus sp. FDAARGOS_1420]|uniref:hypothetical protein n=1 Tax=unclassified Bacillus (in: firmicutes) TaxID=185979 RepID=UPI001C5B2617|nr:hypothetical protein [Bacillus sp. FDAARGOS_1420]MBW3492761.1 hypothetical protein [Bacillus sp. FDAARGOS_1420]
MMKVIEDVRAMSDEEFMSKYEDLVHHFIWKRYKSMLEIVKVNTGLEMEEDGETICKQLGVPLPDVNEALQYHPNTKSLQDVMYTSGSGGKEEILLEDMLEDTQIHEVGEVENHMVLQSFYQTLEYPELIVWDMHSKYKTQQEIGNRVGRCQVQVGRILKRIQKRANEFGKEQGLAT